VFNELNPVLWVLGSDPPSRTRPTTAQRYAAMIRFKLVGVNAQAQTEGLAEIALQNGTRLGRNVGRTEGRLPSNWVEFSQNHCRLECREEQVRGRRGAGDHAGFVGFPCCVGMGGGPAPP
jgi:hypothetical protein